MPIKDNQVVTLNFTLKDEEGSIIEETTKEEPFSYLSGNSQILPKLEENINGMLIGSKKSVVLEPSEAYGEYKEDAIQSVNRSEFPEGTKLEKGMGFVANTPDGRQMPFTVTKVEGDDITLDFNHPLAGKKLTFEVELLNIREASPEELQHGHVHGPGGHHH